MKLLVRNLPRTLSEDDLFEMFRQYGDITSCNLVIDEQTGQSKGFGFVEMPAKDEGKEAIRQLDGKKVHGVTIRVKTTNSR